MRKPSADWPTILEEFEASGLSQLAFSRKKGISPRNLGYWLKKKRKNGNTRNGAAAPGARFIELELGPSGPTRLGEEAELVVELPLGVVMRFRGATR